jgi:hypothetical protein
MRARNIAVIVVLAPQAGSPVRSEAELLNQIIREGVTLERANLLFSIEIGKLPGVEVPAGPPCPPCRPPPPCFLSAPTTSTLQPGREPS